MVSRMTADPDSDFISSIAPDVRTCLRRVQFFERLDDLLCPKNDPDQREVCRNDYTLSKRVLAEAGFNAADLDDIFGVLKSLGGCCDCEVLYNVADSSRVKAEYWRNRADSLEAKLRHRPPRQ